MFRPRLAEFPCAGELGPSVKRRIEKLFLKQRGRCLQVLSGELVGCWLLFSAEDPHLRVYREIRVLLRRLRAAGRERAGFLAVCSVCSDNNPCGCVVVEAVPSWLEAYNAKCKGF